MSLIIVIDPHPILRMGFVQLLNEAFTEATIQADDYSALKKKLKPNPKRCDLILFTLASQDADCPYLNNLTNAYTPRFILLLDEPRTHSSPSHYCQQPLIRGLISKEAHSALITASVKLVLEGGTCFPNPSKNIPPTPITPALASPLKEAELLGLTKRQYEVLVLLAKGHPLKTIARQLQISLATAKSHTETLYQRLDVNSRNAAVDAAMSLGASLCWPQHYPT